VVERRMQALRERTSASDINPLFLCAAETGLREGELIGLKPCDLDFNSRFIADVPPMVLLGELTIATPCAALPRSTVPVTLVPKKLPSITFPPFVSKLIPVREKRLIVSPRTVRSPAVMCSPFAVPALVPVRSTLSTALLPSLGGFVLGLALV